MTGHDLPARQRGLALLVLVVAAGSLAAVVSQWARHGDGAQDWLHGGVAYIDRDDSSQLGWVDWAVVVTRRGLLHPGARRLRLETRVLLGLVPISSQEIRLSENDRATTADFVELLAGRINQRLNTIDWKARSRPGAGRQP